MVGIPEKASSPFRNVPRRPLRLPVLVPLFEKHTSGHPDGHTQTHADTQYRRASQENARRKAQRRAKGHTKRDAQGKVVALLAVPSLYPLGHLLVLHFFSGNVIILEPAS
jgi:hypothetical protein